jgi:parallel beta-helix repeat protein
MWDLEPGSDHQTLDFYGKDEELGITGPSSDETNGWAVDGWAIVGFRQGIIAVGDFSVGSGELGEFAELVSIEPLEPLTAAACPTKADFVVSNEDELHDAVDQAEPGNVIGLDGYIELETTVVIETDGLTLTCATPGSGLYGEPEAPWGNFALLVVSASVVRVERLTFDGTEVRTAYFAEGDEPTFSHNTVNCGWICAWFNGSHAPTITDNRFDSSSTSDAWSAIQIQSGTTHAHVEGNTIVGPSEHGSSGIRIRSGTNHMVIGNKVSGPWDESISARGSFRLENQFIRNRLEGANVYGLDLWGEVCDFIVEDIDTGEIEDECHIFEPAMGNVIRGNRISGAGAGGIIVSSACWNTIVGNNLQGNADDIGIVFFGVETWDFVEENLHHFGTQDGAGANTFVGNGNIVIDEANLDCDGDGEPDPNIITGASAVQHGVNLGRVISDAMTKENDINGLTVH